MHTIQHTRSSFDTMQRTDTTHTPSTSYLFLSISTPPQRTPHIAPPLSSRSSLSCRFAYATPSPTPPYLYIHLLPLPYPSSPIYESIEHTLVATAYRLCQPMAHGRAQNVHINPFMPSTVASGFLSPLYHICIIAFMSLVLRFPLIHLDLACVLDSTLALVISFSSLCHFVFLHCIAVPSPPGRPSVGTPSSSCRSIHSRLSSIIKLRRSHLHALTLRLHGLNHPLFPTRNQPTIPVSSIPSLSFSVSRTVVSMYWNFLLALGVWLYVTQFSR